MHLLRLLLIAAVLSIASVGSLAAEAPESAPSRRWAVIFVGLPGDEAHRALFQETAGSWRKWLTQTLDFPAEQVLPAPPGGESATEAAPLTSAQIQTTLSELSERLQPDDALWLFTLGHGHHDGQRAWLHVAGPDPSDEDLARWLSGVKCREQVLWLTQASSGGFLPRLSRPGRIVITATAAEDEPNETEFPHALGSAGLRPRTELDADGDQQVSLAEFFGAVKSEVQKRYETDQRLPTEHAQLDDNGDGRGSEELPPPAGAARTDGGLARKVFLPFRGDGGEGN